MFRVNKSVIVFSSIFIVLLVGVFAISNVSADDNNTAQSLSAQTQAMTNYEALAAPYTTAPTELNPPSNQWLIYFGPTQEQAAANVAAAQIIAYVTRHSPLQALPTIIVSRPTTWITLPLAQVTLSRSSGNGTSGY